MSETISTLDVRQRIGDILNRVALRHDEFIVQRKGKPLAAIVPVERLEQMRRYARRHGLKFMERQKGRRVSAAEAERLAAEAVRWARRQGRKTRATRPAVKAKK